MGVGVAVGVSVGVTGTVSAGVVTGDDVTGVVAPRSAAGAARGGSASGGARGAGRETSPPGVVAAGAAGLPEIPSVAEDTGADAPDDFSGCGCMNAEVFQKSGGEPLGTLRRTHPRTMLEHTPSVPTSISSSPL